MKWLFLPTRSASFGPARATAPGAATSKRRPSIGTPKFSNSHPVMLEKYQLCEDAMKSHFYDFYDFARVAAPARPRDYIRGPAGACLPLTADARHICRLRATLECKWQIDPASGALLVRWIDSSTDRGARGSIEDDIELQPCQHPDRRWRLRRHARSGLTKEGSLDDGSSAHSA